MEVQEEDMEVEEEFVVTLNGTTTILKPGPILLTIY